MSKPERQRELLHRHHPEYYWADDMDQWFAEEVLRVLRDNVKFFTNEGFGHFGGVIDMKNLIAELEAPQGRKG